MKNWCLSRQVHSTAALTKKITWHPWIVFWRQFWTSCCFYYRNYSRSNCLHFASIGFLRGMTYWADISDRWISKIITLGFCTDNMVTLILFLYCWWWGQNNLIEITHRIILARNSTCQYFRLHNTNQRSHHIQNSSIIILSASSKSSSQTTHSSPIRASYVASVVNQKSLSFAAIMAMLCVISL